MSWKTEFRSFYYDGAPEPDDPVIDPAATAFLVIDVQNTYVERPDRVSVIVLEDCCAAGSDELHRRELEIINMIYCHVMGSRDFAALVEGHGRGMA